MTVVHMAPLFFTNLEYVVLRLARRFLLPRDLHRIGRCLPYYRMNISETLPDHTCGLYVRWLTQAGRSLTGQSIVEIGSGATNAAGYALFCAGAARVWCVEPYVPFDPGEDAALLTQLARRHGRDPSAITAAVIRCASLDDVAAGSADLILSHSVLEHVRDLMLLFSKMNAALSPNGAMLHIVDYRDHFFKYPLHFLQFSAPTWKRFLDPGDLPRWRLSHHRRALERAGFHLRVIQQEEDPLEFARIRPHISRDFDVQDPSLGTLLAVLYCEPGATSSHTRN